MRTWKQGMGNLVEKLREMTCDVRTCKRNENKIHLYRGQEKIIATLGSYENMLINGKLITRGG